MVGGLMETRNILNENNEVVGTLTLPDNTSELEWSEKLNSYIKSELTNEEKWNLVRLKRQKLFLESEWIKLRHKDQLDRQSTTTLSTEQYNNWLDYWQVLRDIPQLYQNPDDIVWPIPPES